MAGGGSQAPQAVVQTPHAAVDELLVGELVRTQQAQEGVGIDCVGRDEPVADWGSRRAEPVS